MMRPLLPKTLKVERLTIAIADLPASLMGTKLVQMSDFHYDKLYLSEKLLTQAIAISNQEKPDLILLTGDFITYLPHPIHDLVLRLKNLTSRYGIYVCLGNHDNYLPTARKRVIKAFDQVGIMVLWNSIATPLGENFPIVGLADYWSKEFNPELVMSQLDPSIPRLVLCHNPDAAMILKKWRVDLQLSGHTHGGQIVIPGLGTAPMLVQKLSKIIPELFHGFIPGLTLSSRVLKNWQWSQGWHQIGRNQLYVNRGLGTYSPGRFFCPPEVTVITLEKR